MELTAIQIGRALCAVTPKQVAKLNEDEARAVFQHYRFIENGGEPFCPRCKCETVWKLKSRPEYKCPICDKRFSVTSGTGFSYRKITFRNLLYIIAEFNISKQGQSATELHARCEGDLKQYKTVWLWLHKLRAALKEEQSKLQLSGEVEIDGAEIGGYIRPKNTKKERTDYRKYPYRASDRKRIVTLARERGGAALAWVAQQEQHAVKPFKDQLLQGTVVFADGGKWTDIRADFELHQISHKEAYYTPEACTNFAESGFNALRTLATIHRHINHNYLDLYAAQLAWRLANVRVPQGQRLASLICSVMSQSRSPMAGYFLPKKNGGMNRLCEIVTDKGEAGFLAAPTGRAKRSNAEGATSVELTSALKLARSGRWNHGFTFVSAKEFMDNRSLLPSRPGVYMMMVANGDGLLARSGYFPDPNMPVWEESGFDHLYTGESSYLRERVEEHLATNGSASTLRETLLALQWSTNALPAGPTISDREATERGLSEWMRENIVIGFKVCGYSREVERNMLQRAASPLNIQDRMQKPYSALLRSLRERFRAEVSNDWLPPEKPVRPKRR